MMNFEGLGLVGYILVLVKLLIDLHGKHTHGLRGWTRLDVCAMMMRRVECTYERP